MNYRLILRYIGYFTLADGLFMLPALLIGLYCGETASVYAFAVTIFLCMAVGFLLTRVRSEDRIQPRESFAIVALGWIIMSLFGALPFLLSGSDSNYIDCFFETVSGFTTTGSSIFTQVENLSRSILYWRSFTHWVGGMGVLVFLLGIVPQARGNGESLYLMQAESPGPSVGKLTPTIRKTARALYTIYLVMTLIEIVMLIAGGMPVFDSVTHAFGTAGTGGFSIKNASIAAYDSTYLQMVIGVFMALFGVNFSVYYLLLTRQVHAALHNDEFRAYWGILLGSSLLIGLNILPMYAGREGYAFRDSFFQVSSIMTTTGYATADFNLWPQMSRYLLVILMIIGASAGSTGGGIKVSRLLLLIRYLKVQMQQMLHPRRVNLIRLDKKTVEDTVMKGTMAFFVAYSLICVISMFIVSLDNFDLESTATAVFACINNIGPGLGIVGPTGNFSRFSNLSKIVLSIDMLLGRLEIFPLLLLAAPSMWKRRSGR